MGLDGKGDGFEIAFELFEDLLLAEVLDGVVACVGSEVGAEVFVGDEAFDGCVECVGNFGWNYDAARGVRDVTAARDDLCDLGAEVGGGDDGSAAGEHAGEFRRHDEIGGTGSLGEEMDVGGVEEVVEAVEGLEGQEGDVGEVGDDVFEVGAEGSVAAEDEVDARVGIGTAGGEGLG